MVVVRLIGEQEQRVRLEVAVRLVARVDEVFVVWVLLLRVRVVQMGAAPRRG